MVPRRIVLIPVPGYSLYSKPGRHKVLPGPGGRGGRRGWTGPRGIPGQACVQVCVGSPERFPGETEVRSDPSTSPSPQSSDTFPTPPLFLSQRQENALLGAGLPSPSPPFMQHISEHLLCTGFVLHSGGLVPRHGTGGFCPSSSPPAPPLSL